MQYKDYKICKKCVMDTSDPDITFDDSGICNHCKKYEEVTNSRVYLEKRSENALGDIIQKIKENGKNNKYDCIIGVSGGVDSSYLAYLTKNLGLRPLAVHLDNGWDSEISVQNIEKLLNKLNIPLFTFILDWDKFKKLQIAFLKSSTPDIEIPTDHAIMAVLYKIASKNKIKFIINGHNHATESAAVSAWSQGHGDWLYIKSVYKAFYKGTLHFYPNMGFFNLIKFTLIKGIKTIPLLDYINYSKDEALRVLKEELGWQEYGHKHFESIYTRFYQGYILPRKFGFDKRRMHLSSLIWNNEISRNEALAKLEEPTYEEEIIKEDRNYFIKKLDLTGKEFDDIMKASPKSFNDYKTYKKIISHYKPLLNLYHKLRYSKAHL